MANLIAGVTTALNLLAAAASCWLTNCRGYIKKWNVSSLFESTIKLCFNRKLSFYCLFDNVAFKNRLTFSASTRLINRDTGISQCWSPREPRATFLFAWLCYQWRTLDILLSFKFVTVIIHYKLTVIAVTLSISHLISLNKVNFFLKSRYNIFLKYISITLKFKV